MYELPSFICSTYNLSTVPRRHDQRDRLHCFLSLWLNGLKFLFWISKRRLEEIFWMLSIIHSLTCQTFFKHSHFIGSGLLGHHKVMLHSDVESKWVFSIVIQICHVLGYVFSHPGRTRSRVHCSQLASYCGMKSAPFVWTVTQDKEVPIHPEVLLEVLRWF